MVEWWNGGMVEWWNGGMVEWWNGGMVEWWNGENLLNGVEYMPIGFLTIVAMNGESAR
jgi:hypothetical protein